MVCIIVGEDELVRGQAIVRCMQVRRRSISSAVASCHLVSLIGFSQRQQQRACDLADVPAAVQALLQPQ